MTALGMFLFVVGGAFLFGRTRKPEESRAGMVIAVAGMGTTVFGLLQIAGF
jgi:hypothetical protein